jgi:hypothetical protein
MTKQLQVLAGLFESRLKRVKRIAGYRGPLTQMRSGEPTFPRKGKVFQYKPTRAYNESTFFRQEDV